MPPIKKTKASVKPSNNVSVKPNPPAKKATQLTPKQQEAVNAKAAVAKINADTKKLFGNRSNSDDARFYTRQQLRKQNISKDYWYL